MTVSKFQKQVTNPFLFRLFLLQKLPLAYIAGLRIKELTAERGVATVKYGWLTQNPFRSMYFACLSMAAEMSTGALILNGVYNSKPGISTLIVKNQAVYHKKAVGTITFTCADGKLIEEYINKAKASGESILADTTSIGKDEAGDVVAEFVFTWSMKVKTSA
jgi:hypothetical protein